MIETKLIDEAILRRLKNPITAFGKEMWDEIDLIVTYFRFKLHFSRDQILRVLYARGGYGRNPDVPQEDLALLVNKTVEVTNKLSYENYLLCPEWKRKRQFIIKRDKICQGCLDAPIHDVHHLTYANVGKEFMYELVGLCRECHSRCHKKYK